MFYASCLVYFPYCCDKISWQMEFKDGRIYFVSEFGDIVYHGVQALPVGTLGIWWHYVQSQEENYDACLRSAPTLFSCGPGSKLRECCPTRRGSSHKIFLFRHASRPIWEVIPDLIKLTTEISHHQMFYVWSHFQCCSEQLIARYPQGQ